MAQLAVVFGADAKSAEPPVDLMALHAKIGQLALENAFVEGTYLGGHAERRKIIERTHDLPICRQP